MHTHPEGTLPAATWGTSIALCLLAALGAVAIARSVPASYAAVPDGGVRFTGQAARGPTGDATPLQPGSSLAADARRRSRCPECGTIEAIHRIEPAGTGRLRHYDPRRIADAESGRATAATVTAYEITVRLRDGTTAVFNEATPRGWRPGNRVMVIPGMQVASR